VIVMRWFGRVVRCCPHEPRPPSTARGPPARAGLCSSVRSPLREGQTGVIPLLDCVTGAPCGTRRLLLACLLHGSIRGGQPTTTAPGPSTFDVPCPRTVLRTGVDKSGDDPPVGERDRPGGDDRRERGPVADQPGDLGQVWNRVIADLGASGAGGQPLSARQRAFLRLTRPLGLIDGTALLAVPTEFAKDAIERILRRPISDALGKHLGVAVNLAVVVDASAASGGTEVPEPPGTSARSAAPTAPVGVAASELPAGLSAPTEPRYPTPVRCPSTTAAIRAANPEATRATTPAATPEVNPATAPRTAPGHPRPGRPTPDPRPASRSPRGPRRG
jgi:hypothetical protein